MARTRRALWPGWPDQAREHRFDAVTRREGAAIQDRLCLREIRHPGHDLIGARVKRPDAPDHRGAGREDQSGNVLHQPPQRRCEGEPGGAGSGPRRLIPCRGRAKASASVMIGKGIQWPGVRNRMPVTESAVRGLISILAADADRTALCCDQTGKKSVLPEPLRPMMATPGADGFRSGPAGMLASP